MSRLFLSRNIEDGNGRAAGTLDDGGRLGSWQELMTVDGHTFGVQVPNLLPYISYEFRVKAANVNGFGQPSEAVRVDAMCITPPIDLIELVPSQRSAAVRWRFHIGYGPLWLRFTYVAPVLVKK
jgi:hypothetical protein